MHSESLKSIPSYEIDFAGLDSVEAEASVDLVEGALEVEVPAVAGRKDSKYSIAHK